ncbi:MAG: hypothetical protein LJE84_05845, partial [Gammaproteobacteria bacterium]|nr:hypothetical protein [Gammaproteobacteria bacterium]
MATLPLTQPNPYSPGGEPRQGVHLADVLRILRRHKWGIAVLAILGAVIGGIRAMQAIPVYQARLTMLIEPNTPKVFADDISAQNTPYLFYETQYEIIRSRAVAKRVVDRIGMADDAQLRPKVEPGWFEGLVARLRGEAEGPAESPAPELDAARAEYREWRIDSVRGGINVHGGVRSQMVTVTYDSTDPDEAARVANAVADAYMEMGLEARLDLTRQATGWLTERLE